MLTTLENYAREHGGDLSLDLLTPSGTATNTNPNPAWGVEYTQYAPEHISIESFKDSLEEALSELIVELGLLTLQDTKVVVPGIAKLTQPLPDPLPIEDTVSILNAMGPLDDKRKHLLLDLDWENDTIRVSLHTSPPNSEPKSAGYYSDVNKPATSVTTVTGDFMVNPHPQTDTPEPEDVGPDKDGGYTESNLPPHLREAIDKLEAEGSFDSASRPAAGDRPSAGPSVFKEREGGL